jgi:hypothetical protein
MADLTITAGNVVSGDGAHSETGTAGETITAGKAVYKSTTGASSGKYMLADNNSATLEAKLVRGIARNGASLNQPLSIQRSGPITIGATLVAGARYYLSETPGGLQPEADLVTAGENICLVGLAASTTVLNIDIQAPGVAV